jgi:hypothetical protein
MSIEGVELADDPAGVIRDRVIEKAREVSDRTLERLRGLTAELPEGTVERVELLHGDPDSERRRAARLSDGAHPVTVCAAGSVAGSVRDHGPTGLAIRLPAPVGVGWVVRVLLPATLGGGWVTVEVRHCRPDADGWLAGCELVPGQPPL